MMHLEAAPPAPSITTHAPIHDTRAPVSTAAPNLWERIAIACRVKHYSLSTERTYVAWARKFVAWSGRRHPRTMGAAEVEAYLTHLAVDHGVSASTQNQALSALLQGQALDSINDAAIRKLAAERKAQAVDQAGALSSNATVNRHLAELGKILHYAHRRGWLAGVPPIAKLHEPARRVAWLTREQAATLLAELPSHLRAMAGFALATGLRESTATMPKDRMSSLIEYATAYAAQCRVPTLRGDDA